MLKYSKLSRYKILKIIECFCIDIDATNIAQLLQLNRETINYYFNTSRKLIHSYQNSEKDKFVGAVEVDESFFGTSVLGEDLPPICEAEALWNNRSLGSMNEMEEYI